MTPEAFGALVDSLVDQHIRNSAVTRAGNDANQVWEGFIAALKAQMAAALAPAGAAKAEGE